MAINIQIPAFEQLEDGVNDVLADDINVARDKITEAFRHLQTLFNGIETLQTNAVTKGEDEEISGVKNFLNGIKTARITSDGALVLEAFDAPVKINANGEYEFYAGDILVDGKSIMTDSPEYESVKTEIIKVDKIMADNDNGILDVEVDNFNINVGSNATINGEGIATEKYVDEVLKDVEGGSIIIDSVPIEGSTNAVSSGGVYTAIKNKAEKSYVDSSIQQAILDSWAEVIEP